METDGQDERKEILRYFTGQALAGLAANPTLAVEIEGAGAPVDVIAQAAYRLGLRTTVLCETYIDEASKGEGS